MRWVKACNIASGELASVDPFYADIIELIGL